VEPSARIHVRPPQTTPAHRKALRERVRADCTNKPGVYRMLSATGSVIYVGQSRVLRTRLLSYFRATGRRHKGARILRHAFDIQWEYTPTEFSALLRELRLIKQHRPHFNTMMVTDDWPRAYIALTGGPVPGLRVVPRSDDPNAVALFGPFRKVGFLRESVRALADAMGLRDCALEEAELISLTRASRAPALWFADDDPPSRSAKSPRRTRAPGCLRHELGSCAGPCVGAGERAAYHGQAATIRAFLEGQSDAPVVALTRAMQEASQALEFERAAVIRDRLERVQWLHQRVQHFHANMDRLTFRYETAGPDGDPWVYLIRRGTVRAELPVPQTAAERKALAALAKRIFQGPDPTGADIPLHDLDEFYLVASWFRRRPTEKARTSGV
jgi:excinuclease ABC subunit C